MTEGKRIAPEDWGDALDDTDGHQLIVAGPGTGKTEFLIRRIARILETGKAKRDQILALTFSRRAARSISDRIVAHLGGSTAPVDATTFHSIALQTVETAGAGQAPTPLTTPEHVAVVRDLLATDPLENWPVPYRAILDTPGFAEEIADFLLRCSERLLSPDDLSDRAAERADWSGIPSFYARYLDHLREIGRLDYGTLLTEAVSALEAGASPLLSKYEYVLVDEFQDTSPAQARLAELLSATSGNLMVTGDPYQSIYSFRGAELRNIEDFAHSHENVKRFVLDRSLRVPDEILSSALRVVSSGSLPGASGPVTPAQHSGRVETYIFDQETAEAEWIAGQVDRAIRVDGVPPSGIAVLVRSKQEMLNEMSRALARRQIAHDRPDRRLIDHPAVQMIADLVILATVSDDDPLAGASLDEAARRFLLGPLVGVSLGRQREMRERRQRGSSWSTVLVEQPGLEDLGHLIGESEWATSLPAVEGFWSVWSSSKRFSPIVDAEDRADWRRAYASFGQVLERQAERDPGLSLQGFFALAEDESFEATPLLTHEGEESAVVLTTLHQAKGLEFEQVFIANAVEGVFPDLRRSRRMLRPELLSPGRLTDAAAVSAFQVQAEMRLAYTAMTRASRRVVWTATEAGVDQGERRPSRFLLAASGEESMSAIGRPGRDDLDPVSVREVEVRLRRTVSDPGAPAHKRTAAASLLAERPLGDWDARLFPGIRRPGPDSPILGATFSMSPSQAEGYSRCPRRYAVERRLRLREPGSPNMAIGSMVHAALEMSETRALGSGERHGEVEVAVAALNDSWDDGQFATEALSHAWRNRAEQVIRNLYAKWPASSAPASHLEVEVELEIDGVRWYGIVDRVERSDLGCHIVDYKTGKSAPRLEDAAVSIQLGFYALALEADPYSPSVVSAELWYPATDAKSLTRRALDMGRLDEVEETMRAITSQIAAEHWEPKVSSACDRCGIKSSCPAWPEGRGAYLS